VAPAITQAANASDFRFTTRLLPDSNLQAQSGSCLYHLSWRKDTTGLVDFRGLYENTAHGRLKTKVKSQILNNIDGLDEESAAKYEVFIEELDREINNNPADIARMIELLLSEGNVNFK